MSVVKQLHVKGELATRWRYLQACFYVLWIKLLVMPDQVCSGVLILYLCMNGRVFVTDITASGMRGERLWMTSCTELSWSCIRSRCWYDSDTFGCGLFSLLLVRLFYPLCASVLFSWAMR